MNTTPFYDKPCAAPGLTSYRYRGRYGWIMIGAKHEHDALSQALRSFGEGVQVSRDNLQVWDLIAGEYVEVAL